MAGRYFRSRSWFYRYLDNLRAGLRRNLRRLSAAPDIHIAIENHYQPAFIAIWLMN